MKKLILFTLILILISTTAVKATSVSGCGTLIETADCSWFEFVFQKYKLNIPPDLTIPIGTNEFYIEGEVRFNCNEQDCPDNSVPHCIDITVINACEGCCIGVRGNVDCDPDNIIDISDLVALLKYMFQNGEILCCVEEGDFNGDGAIDISDLVNMVSFFFLDGPYPAPCQSN